MKKTLNQRVQLHYKQREKLREEIVTLIRQSLTRKTSLAKAPEPVRILADTQDNYGDQALQQVTAVSKKGAYLETDWPEDAYPVEWEFILTEDVFRIYDTLCEIGKIPGVPNLQDQYKAYVAQWWKDHPLASKAHDEGPAFFREWYENEYQQGL